MSDEAEDTGGNGCLLIIGIVAVSLAIGCLTSEGWGWLTFGVICILVSFADTYCRSKKP